LLTEQLFILYSNLLPSGWCRTCV